MPLLLGRPISSPAKCRWRRPSDASLSTRRDCHHGVSKMFFFGEYRSRGSPDIDLLFLGSGCVVGNPYLGITSGLPVTRPKRSSDPYKFNERQMTVLLVSCTPAFKRKSSIKRPRWTGSRQSTRTRASNAPVRTVASRTPFTPRIAVAKVSMLTPCCSLTSTNACSPNPRAPGSTIALKPRIMPAAISRFTRSAAAFGLKFVFAPSSLKLVRPSLTNVLRIIRSRSSNRGLCVIFGSSKPLIVHLYI